VAARAFLKELKLEPDKDVAILQVGGSTERAVAFRTGRNNRFSRAAGNDSPRSGYAAPRLDQHGGFSQGLSVPLCLSDGVEKVLFDRTATP
jgi:hypothetical protein